MRTRSLPVPAPARRREEKGKEGKGRSRRHFRPPPPRMRGPALPGVPRGAPAWPPGYCCGQYGRQCPVRPAATPRSRVSLVPPPRLPPEAPGPARAPHPASSALCDPPASRSRAHPAGLSPVAALCPPLGTSPRGFPVPCPASPVPCPSSFPRPLLVLAAPPWSPAPALPEPPSCPCLDPALVPQL